MIHPSHHTIWHVAPAAPRSMKSRRHLNWRPNSGKVFSVIQSECKRYELRFLPDFRGDSRLFLFWSRRVVRLSASVWRTRRSEKDERDTTRRKAPLTDRPTRTLPYPLFFGPRRKGFGRGQDPFARKLWNYAATHGGPSLF